MNTQNRINGLNNKGFMTSFDPQTFKSQPAPSSSRLKQRQNNLNGTESDAVTGTRKENDDKN